MELTLENLSTFARSFVDSLPTVEGEHAYIVGLSGDLGSGKTTFVQHLARELGVQDPVTSPTFVIAERYDIEHPPYTSLVHIDAYRLTPKEAHTIGWEEFVQNPKNLVVVEWPEQLGSAFPADAPVLTFSVVGEGSRTVEYAKR